MELIDKSALVAEIEKLQLCTMDEHMNYYSPEAQGEYNALCKLESFIDTLEVKEVNIADMADEYYDALIKEADWMDEGTMGHCRLAYYNGCKDVLNKIQKGE